MSEDQCPKEFVKHSEVLPILQHGITTLKDFESDQAQLQNLERLKRVGLSDEDIKLYLDNEAGTSRSKMQSDVLKSRLNDIYQKLMDYEDDSNDNPKPSVSNENRFSSKQYSIDHPINNLKSIEDNLFGHLKDNIQSLTKRRKILRRLERRKELIMSKNPYAPQHMNTEATPRPGSLWDVKEMPQQEPKPTTSRTYVIGPKRPTMYTIKDQKIVRLEPSNSDNNEYETVDIVTPANRAEERLLEGTKVSVDDIRKIERFKDYEPGVPSKVLYIKNISPSLTEDELRILFNQFICSNGGPVQLQLLCGRMRGQAFVTFRDEDLAIEALQEVNGTIMKGKPLIVEFGRNNNRAQD